MKNMFVVPHRESSSLFKNNNRKYIKQSQTPNQSLIYLQNNSKSTSSHEIKGHLLSGAANQRYSEAAINGGGSKLSTSKIKSREDSIVRYELGKMSHSKNFIADKRKRGKSSFYKKAADVSNISEAFFAPASKYPTTKEASKASSPSESGFSIEAAENEVEEIHYQMVEFQQTCKRAVKN